MLNLQKVPVWLDRERLALFWAKSYQPVLGNLLFLFECCQGRLETALTAMWPVNICTSSPFFFLLVSAKLFSAQPSEITNTQSSVSPLQLVSQIDIVFFYLTLFHVRIQRGLQKKDNLHHFLQLYKQCLLKTNNNIPVIN